MEKQLLIVPDSLANESFDGYVVVSNRSLAAGNHVHNPWPPVSDLRRLIEEYACTAVAVTFEPNADAVQRLVAARSGSTPDVAKQIVFADAGIPVDLRKTFPAALLPILQRVLPCDLIELSTAAIQDSVPTASMPAALLRGDVKSSVVETSPSIDRFPAAGPAAFGADCGLSSDLLSKAVDHALADVQLAASDRKCVTAGVLLLWDFLDASHEISQTMEGRGTPRTGDYWHGIMHRREPDAGNASYWFRRLGVHPAFASLSSHLDRWMKETGASDAECKLVSEQVNADGRFDPFAMIELSTKAIRKPRQLEDSTLRRVQYLEILNLLSASFDA
ncbi:MAG TPA: hypothetical protein PLY87_19900 [Planctomycetaceae bacterium]|nr:hypothetical protein [Planctomycetaceae bacterium]HQZ67368.1 hypothetical protein [Planctomycetaceae bacterium]